MSKDLTIRLNNSPARPWPYSARPRSDFIIDAEVVFNGPISDNKITAIFQFNGINQDSVYFLDGNGNISDEKTYSVKCEGQSVDRARFVATKPFEGIISVGLYSDGVYISDTVDYTEFSFENSLYTLYLDVTPGSVDLGETITARVTLMCSGNPAVDQPFVLDLSVDGPAKFVQNPDAYEVYNNGYSLKGKTANSGSQEVKIETISVGCSWIIVNVLNKSIALNDVILKELNIKVAADAFLTAIALSLTTYENNWVACGALDMGGNSEFYEGYAPYDGVTPIRVSCYAGRFSNAAVHYGNVPVIISVDGPARFVIDKKINSPFNFISDQKVIVSTLSNGITPFVELICNEDYEGNIYVSTDYIGNVNNAQYYYYHPNDDSMLVCPDLGFDSFGNPLGFFQILY
ncbi:hypothetical protein ABE527_17325 [Brucella sp. TWI432]